MPVPNIVWKPIEGTTYVSLVVYQDPAEVFDNYRYTLYWSLAAWYSSSFGWSLSGSVKSSPSSYCWIDGYYNPVWEWCYIGILPSCFPIFFDGMNKQEDLFSWIYYLLSKMSFQHITLLELLRHLINIIYTQLSSQIDLRSSPVN